MVAEIEKEYENAYEARAMEEEEDVMEIFSQHGEYAAGSLLETAITRLATTKMEMDIPQLEMDGWSVCGSEVSTWSDENSECELL